MAGMPVTARAVLMRKDRSSTGFHHVKTSTRCAILQSVAGVRENED
ncbi:hypothetical protein Rcae01_04367 [Novipirellula caenicola]|uniref:Uncharacterized protein n=1 Tax=Novipirellula caenicola TaxID=1536901 RepID=A0ABP9VZ70_9BACT